MPSVLVLGCGYTGARVAGRLLARGERVIATSRDPRGLEPLARLGARVLALDASDERSVLALAEAVRAGGPGLRVLCSIPPLPEGSAPREPIAPLLRALAAQLGRVLYLSTTSVYGDAELVDERTAPSPRDEASRLRLEAERAAAGGPWSALVLRPAAIYGPGRGVQVGLRAGGLGRVQDVDRVVSRVHVDDLAALVEAGLLGDATGAYPVADDEPATTREVIGFCAGLGLPPVPMPPAPPAGSPVRGRRVDGRAIRALLSVTFRYPSYRTGIAAAVEAERRGSAPAG